MPGFFEALKNFKPKSANKKHFVTIDDKKIEVSLDKAMEVSRHGIENFKFKVASKINNINQKPAKDKKLLPEEVQSITNTYFKEDIEKTEQLLNIDLSIWK